MSDQIRIRVFSVDDHPLLREGIAAIINNQPDMEMVAQAATGSEAIQTFRQYQPDVTLMDLRLPDMSGIDALIAIRTDFPEARVIMLTTFEGDVDIRRSLEAGARGYMLKNMPPRDLVEVIRQVHAGKKRIPAEVATQLAEYMGEDALTEREIDVLRHVASGNRNREIGERLFISEETVKVHIKHIMEKLRASDRTQAVSIGAVGVTAIVLGGVYLTEPKTSTLGTWIVGLLAGASGLLLLIGFLTKAACAVAGLNSVGVALSWFPTLPLNSFDTKLSLFFLMIMAAAIALLGPGAYSLDARLFGRREIIIPPTSIH